MIEKRTAGAYTRTMLRKKILFIEDDSAGREMSAFNLKKAGFEVDTASGGREGLSIFDPAVHTLVITDVKMPDISGMDVLAAIKKDAPSTPVIVITAYGNVDLAVKAMKEGACDFIGKPFSRDHLLLAVEKALESAALREEVRSLRSRARGVERPIIYQSASMSRLLAMVDKMASSDATILVAGESGTGKELVARRIHGRSARSDGPFVAVNLAAMPAELTETELFGHTKGAFTGANEARTGRFRLADGGTLFLDEITELPLSLQGKLLRVLQEKVVDVVGSDIPENVDVRVVAATNRDLEREVAEGRFREDLFYRVNVLEVRVDPLRARPDDIPLLCQHFVELYSSGQNLSIPDEVLELLLQHNWPGNVRELENVCQRLAVLANSDRVDAASLPPSILESKNGGSDSPSTTAQSDTLFTSLPEDGLSLMDLERRVITAVLEKKKGNVTQTALYLKIPRHVLAYRMEKYGIRRNS